MYREVKITVVKCAYNEDLVKQYASPGVGPCTAEPVGKVYYTNGWQKPEGLCDNAWKSMMEYALALAQGGGGFFGGEIRDPKSFVASCNDGLRPVSFLLEATDKTVLTPRPWNSEGQQAP